MLFLGVQGTDELACEADEERNVVHCGESSYIGRSRGHDRPVRGTIRVRKRWSANSREQETGGAFVKQVSLRAVNRPWPPIADTRLSGTRLLIARSVWIGLILIFCGFYLAALLVYSVQLHGFQEGVYAHLISMTLGEERTRARGDVSVEFGGCVGSIPKWLLGCHSGQAIRLFSPNLMSSIRSCMHFYMSFERKKRCLHPILFLEISPFVYLMGEA